MKKPFRHITLALSLLFSLGLLAQNYTVTPSGVKAKTEGLEMEIQFLSPEIVRVVKFPEGSTPDNYAHDAFAWYGCAPRNLSVRKTW